VGHELRTLREHIPSADARVAAIYRGGKSIKPEGTTVIEHGDEVFFLAARENIQIHGGVGVTWEASPHLFFRRARHLSLVCGASDGWAERLAADLCENTSAPCIGAEIA